MDWMMTIKYSFAFYIDGSLMFTLHLPFRAYMGGINCELLDELGNMYVEFWYFSNTVANQQGLYFMFWHLVIYVLCLCICVSVALAGE